MLHLCCVEPPRAKRKGRKSKELWRTGLQHQIARLNTTAVITSVKIELVSASFVPGSYGRLLGR